MKLNLNVIGTLTFHYSIRIATLKFVIDRYPSIPVNIRFFGIQVHNHETMARLFTTIALCLAASASAFAPAPQAAKTTALNVEIKDQIGVQAPVGYFE